MVPSPLFLPELAEVDDGSYVVIERDETPARFVEVYDKKYYYGCQQTKANRHPPIEKSFTHRGITCDKRG